MIFVPMLHYLQNKNSFSGNEDGMRYLITPGKRSVPDPDGGEEAKKEEAILTVDLWPEPWTLDKTHPALRRREIFPMTEEGRTAVAQYLNDAYNAEPERWSAHPSILDYEPWTPPAPEPDAETQHCGAHFYIELKISRVKPCRLRSWSFPSWALRRNITSGWLCMCWPPASLTRRSSALT